MMELTIPHSTLFAVSGGDAAGKTEIIRLTRSCLPAMQWLPSYTTREPRNGETFENTGYKFYSDCQFNMLWASKEYIWQPVCHAGNRYGNRRNEVIQALHGPRPYISAFTMETIRALKEWVAAYRLAVSEIGPPEHLRVISVFVTVREDVRRERMLARGDAPDMVEKKLHASQDWDTKARELETQHGERVFDYFIDNTGSIDVAVAALYGIILLATGKRAGIET